MFRLRLKFSKHGPIRFIGHLDVLRYFQKAIRRAGIDVAYSGGFSPRQQIGFAHPLSVGATSDGEYMDMNINSFKDIRLTALSSTSDKDSGNKENQTASYNEYVSESELNELIDRLNKVCNEGISISDAKLLSKSDKKAMAAVAACRWRVAFNKKIFDEEDISDDSLNEAFDGFMLKDNITVKKEGKAGSQEINIRPFVYEAKRYLNSEYELLLKSGSEDNIKPGLFIGAFYKYIKDSDRDRFDDPKYPSELEKSVYKLHRLETYLSGDDGRGVYIEPIICRKKEDRLYI